MDIAVDIDGILTIEWEEWGDEAYRNRTPDMKNISIVNQLYFEGHYIMLFTARHPEDRSVTTWWLDKHEVRYHEIRFGKPHYDFFLEDKSIPQGIVDMGRYLRYKFNRSCWRYRDGRMVDENEYHPCFFCGFEISLRVPDCGKCGIMPCPSCKRCLCNIPFISYLTLVRIHEKYCCNLPQFSGDIKLDGIVDMDIINRVTQVVKRCAKLEGMMVDE